MKDNSSIKEKIYETRRRKGLSQEEMANRLGMSLNSYRHIVADTKINRFIFA